MTELLTPEELPPTFEYPAEFVRIVELGLVNLEPWWIEGGNTLRQRASGLKLRYPTRALVPFASRQDNDDLACWDLSEPGRVVIVHDFARPGWEAQGEWPDFYSWLRQAVEDLIDWS